MRYLFLILFCLLSPVNSFAQEGTDLSVAASALDNAELKEQDTNEEIKSDENNSVVTEKSLNVDNLFVATNDVERAIKDQLLYVMLDVDVNSMRSLLFTKWQHELIISARRGLNPGLSSTQVESYQGDGIKDITLGGIVYKSASNWTIWLNNTRVTPDAIPSQILDLKVFKDYIKVEWFDQSRNLIFPIKLRPHERFNIDTRLFFKGQ